jgi:hypothetical protein
MIAGILANSGYFMGRGLIPPRPANPKGFFETSQINLDINEALLEGAAPGSSLRLRRGQRWLDILCEDIRLPKNAAINKRIKTMVSRTPFCYKDPRFCYTIPAWRPFLKDTKFICVFRHPASTIASIVKECKTASYLKSLRMTPAWATAVWQAMYRQVMNRHSRHGEWLFIHYDQAITKAGMSKIADFLDTQVDYSFPEKRLKRPIPKVNVHRSLVTDYKQLCGLAGMSQ